MVDIILNKHFGHDERKLGLTDVWHNDGKSWNLLSASGFPNEKTLHDLIEGAPHVLPLSGQPQLTIVGREVNLGGNYADLIAIDEAGQIVVIEIKLRNNAESRRTVIAQILTYAAVLHGMTVESLHTALAGYLTSQQFKDIAEAVENTLQTESIKRETFDQNIASSLSNGLFRLVLVLDQAPDELIRLVGYLDTVAVGLTIDLVVVSAYRLGEEQMIVPQRIEPEKERAETPHPKQPLLSNSSATRYEPGSHAFASSIQTISPEYRPTFERLIEWAHSLEASSLASLRSTIGSNRWVLTPYFNSSKTGLMTIWNETKRPSIVIYRSALENWSPNSIPAIEAAVAPKTLNKHLTVTVITEDLLSALRNAYQEAAKGNLSVSSQ